MKLLQIIRKHSSLILLIFLTVPLLYSRLLAATPVTANPPPCDTSKDFNDVTAPCVGADQEIKGLNLAKTEHTSMQYKEMSITSQAIGVGKSEKLTQADIKQSAAGQMGDTIATMYNSPPANLALWVKDTGQTLGFIPRSTYAQAQGVGFNGLKPLLDVWKIFRNFAYVLLALAIIVVGFMIMFRKKIDPHTVVSIQNALPRIIMVLILITFSYAIVGLLIDLMYVVMFAVVTMLSPAIHSDPSSLIGSYVIGQPGELWTKLFAPANMFDAAENTIGGIGGGLIGFALGGGPLSPITGIIGAVVGIIISSAANSSAGGLLSPILWLVFSIALLFTFFRIFFMLVTAYIQILIATIIGPIQILLDVFPGINSFQNWFMGIVGNLLTFAMVSILMLLNAVILEHVGTSDLWSPPFIGYVDAGLLKAIIGVGGMVIIPNLINSMKQALKSQSPVSLGVGTVVAPTMGVAQSAVSLGSQFYYLQHGPLGSIASNLANRGKKHTTGTGA